MPTDPFNKVKAYFSPGNEAVDTVVGFIARTKHTFDCAVFSITYPAIVEALLNAHQRGIRGGDGGAIRVLTDKDMMETAAQKTAIKRLTDAGLNVLVDTESGSMHNKYALSDYGRRGAAVICGSYNWTARATQRNRESLVRIRVRAVIDQFRGNFETAWMENVLRASRGPEGSMPPVQAEPR